MTVRLPQPERDWPFRAPYCKVKAALGIASSLNLAKRGGCWFERGQLNTHLGVEADFRPACKARAALLILDLEQLIGNL